MSPRLSKSFPDWFMPAHARIEPFFDNIVRVEEDQSELFAALYYFDDDRTPSRINATNLARVRRMISGNRTFLQELDSFLKSTPPEGNASKGGTDECRYFSLAPREAGIIADGARLKFLQIRVALCDGDTEQAATYLRSLNELAKLVCGGGNASAFATGSIILLDVYRAMFVFLYSVPPSARIAKSMSSVLSDAFPRLNSFANSCFFDVMQDVITRLRDCRMDDQPVNVACRTDGVIAALTNQFQTFHECDPPKGVWSYVRNHLDVLFPRKVNGSDEVLALLDGNDNPFDPDETIDLLGAEFTRFIKQLELSPKCWSQLLDASINNTYLLWPEELRLPYRALYDPIANLSRSRTDRGYTIQEHNALGKFVIGDTAYMVDLVCGTYLWFFLFAKLQHTLTTVVIAIKEFAVREQHYPASIEQLVNGGALPSLPIDPFTGESLQFDSIEGVVISDAPRSTVWESIGPIHKKTSCQIVVRVP